MCGESAAAVNSRYCRRHPRRPMMMMMSIVFGEVYCIILYIIVYARAAYTKCNNYYIMSACNNILNTCPQKVTNLSSI